MNNDLADQLLKDGPDGFQRPDDAVEIHAGFDRRQMLQRDQRLGRAAQSLIEAEQQLFSKSRGQNVAREVPKLADGGQPQMMQSVRQRFADAQTRDAQKSEQAVVFPAAQPSSRRKRSSGCK